MEASSSNTIELDYSFDGEYGGIFNNQRYYWVISENELQLFKLPQGTRNGYWRFMDRNTDPLIISIVSEVYIHNKSFLFIGMKKQNGEGEIRIIDPLTIKTERIIQLPYIPLSIEVIKTNNKPLNSDSMNSNIYFKYPIAIGTSNGIVLIMDLYFQNDIIKSIVDAEEIISNSYDSINDLGKIWNQPYYILSQNKTKRSITSLKQSINSNGERILFIGNNYGDIIIYSLDSFELLIQYKGKTKDFSILSFCFSDYSDTGSLIVCYSSLDNSKKRIIRSSKTYAEMILYHIEFTDKSLHPVGHSKIFKNNKDNRKVKRSKLLYSNMLPLYSKQSSEHCLFIWHITCSNSSTDICMELLNLDQMIYPINNENDKSIGYSIYNIQSPINNPVCISLMESSVEDFKAQNFRYIPNLFKNNVNSNQFKDSISFNIKICGFDSIRYLNFLGSQKLILNHISQNIMSLPSQIQLKNELDKCIQAGLIQNTTENELLFDLYDLLLQRNMFSVLCKYITIAPRLEPIIEWILRKSNKLLTIIEYLHNTNNDNNNNNISQNDSYLNHINNIFITVGNISILINTLLYNENRINQKYNELKQIYEKLEIESQYLELLSWINQYKVFFISNINVKLTSDRNIKLLYKQTENNNIDLDNTFNYPPNNIYSLLNDCWRNYNTLLHSQLIISKLKLVYYYLIDIFVKSQESNTKKYQEILFSFSQTFNQILTKEHQKLIKAYWLLDNLNTDYSLLSNAAEYLQFDIPNQKSTLIDIAYSYLTSPGVIIDWSSDIFKQFCVLKYEYAERFIQRDDFSVCETEYFDIINLLLPKNLYLSLQFLRQHCKSLYNNNLYKDLLVCIFDYCLKNDCIESLFLLSFYKDEEIILLDFLEQNYKNIDKRVLYYLQRSQFIKAFHTSNQSNIPEHYQHLINNYKSILPKTMLQYSKTLSNDQDSSNDNHLMDIEDNNNNNISPIRNRNILKTPKTEKIPSKLMDHKSYFAPSLEQNSKKIQPFTPYINPKTPSKRLQLTQSKQSPFIPFQRSSSRQTRTRPSTPSLKSIPFNAV